METPKIFESEYRFCLLLWEYEPINSTIWRTCAGKNWAGPKPPPIRYCAAWQSGVY